MSDEPLRRLAESAGLILHWTDYKGVHHEVDPDIQRAVLAALQLPAATPGEISDSIERLEVERLLVPPAMLIGRCDRPTSLPPALHVAAEQPMQLHLEEGGSRDLRACRDARGQPAVPQIDTVGYHRLELAGSQLTLAITPVRGHSVADLGAQRRWGISAQLYSLRRPDDCGCGDFGALAALAREAAGAGADALAISPVHALFSADASHYSPYSPSSRLFLNALHVDVDALVNRSTLGQWVNELGTGGELDRLRQAEFIDWETVARCKLRLLRHVWSQLGARWVDSDHALAQSFRAFCRQGGAALRDHACFEALHAHFCAQDPAQWHWRHWPTDYRAPHGQAVDRFAAEQADAVNFHMFLQWLAARGLGNAQRSAREAGMAIGVISDLAVGTLEAGSHVWSHQSDFLTGVSIGAPPDAINTIGQNWGLTTFSPVALQRRGYAPLLDILHASLRLCGGLRIDHILGMRRLWVVPEGAVATAGVYLRYPEEDMLQLIALESARHRAVIVGEDLGTVPPGFSERINAAGLLGMEVLWFQRDYGFFVEPQRWSARALATTSTHDLATVAGWWRGNDLEWQARTGMLPPDSDLETERTQRAHDRHMLWGALQYAGQASGEQPPDSDTETVVDAALGFVASTPSPLVSFPLEDVLGEVEQPNLPGTIDQHPNWRRRLPAPASELLQQPAVAQRLARIRSSRNPS